MIRYRVIYRFNKKYTVKEMCGFFKVSQSGYYEWLKRMAEEDKDEVIGNLIMECQRRTKRTYGYRRIVIWLLRETGLVINHKAVLRIMNKYGLLSEIRRRRKQVHYEKQIRKYENLLKRNFHADRPNEKWVTDISYIFSKQGVIYLSIIKDLYDNYIVAYNIGSENNNRLVLDTLKRAKKEITTKLQLHSDQGFQYTSQAYSNLTKEYNILPSMSRPGTPLDNACVENFFGTLKSEWLYKFKPKTNEEARLLIEEYINFYNYERIQLKTKQTPFEKRCLFRAI